MPSIPWRKLLSPLSDALRRLAGRPAANVGSGATEVEGTASPRPHAPAGSAYDRDLPEPRKRVVEPPPARRRKRASLIGRLRDPRSVRDAIVLKEILDRPVALARRRR